MNIWWDQKLFRKAINFLQQKFRKSYFIQRASLLRPILKIILFVWCCKEEEKDLAWKIPCREISRKNISVPAACQEIGLNNFCESFFCFKKSKLRRNKIQLPFWCSGGDVNYVKTIINKLWNRKRYISNQILWWTNDYLNEVRPFNLWII